MAGADFAFLGIALNGLGYNLDDRTWGVCGAVVLAILAIELNTTVLQTCNQLKLKELKQIEFQVIFLS
ncbi:MAG TPA: hypothetical protein VNW97_08570 [Candidatus Saccharimonadales bacterium]|jgi:hypothetical protein|nr:hypothetical protein [Candidatus Saccharimonadales bacterium]